VQYGGIRAVKGIDLEVAEGELVCLIGANGAGKTSTLKAICRLIPSQAKALSYAGEDISHAQVHELPRKGLVMVPEGRGIFPQLTVEENLRVGLGVGRMRGIPAHVYEMFPVLKQMLRRKGGDLSGGQQQQLAIGRALVLDPKLLILDEPTEGIQPNIVHEIGDVILKLNREAGVTVLLVEQKLPFARRVASEFRILEKGRCVAEGAIDALTDDVVHDHLSV
jgi:urea transport system ATP-binding protein